MTRRGFIAALASVGAALALPFKSKAAAVVQSSADAPEVVAVLILGRLRGKGKYRGRIVSPVTPVGKENVIIYDVTSLHDAIEGERTVPLHAVGYRMGITANGLPLVFASLIEFASCAA